MGGSTLLAVLATPPLATSGDRTRHRLDLASVILGCSVVEIGNLLTAPTHSVLDIAIVGAAAAAWEPARAELAERLSCADEVLLGWGHTEPTGPARRHHRAQVDWLTEQLLADGRTCWTVGPTPRHPSRWQRYTARHYPGLNFEDALGQALQRCSGYRAHV